MVSKLSEAKIASEEQSLRCVSPDDAKYRKTTEHLAPYLSADAEWRKYAEIQLVLLQTRKEFGKAEQKHVDEVEAALGQISPLNMALLEEQVTHHDQLAVIEEIGRFVSPETKALLHPGTTSYDILDTARYLLFQDAWSDIMRPEIEKSIKTLCDFSETTLKTLQAGRTHLQNTSPVPFGATLAQYARRFAERVELCDNYFGNLKGKVSGIVGTGASIDMVFGKGKSIEFEKAVLDKLGMKPDYAATQIVQKEWVADVGHGLTSLMHVLYDFSEDMRKLYSTAISEVTSRANAKRLGGSSADATKNNPIHWENISGTVGLIEGGMRALYSLIQSDFQRDLRNSKPARYQPQQMMCELYESFTRLNNRCLSQLSVNEDRLNENLESVRQKPSEAMVAILRGEGWLHPEYGPGHTFVKEIAKNMLKTGNGLLETALKDPHFQQVYNQLPTAKKAILNGKLENYLGSAAEKAQLNISFAREVVNQIPFGKDNY